MKPAQNLQSDTAALAMPEGRRVGQAGHEIAKAYLLGRLVEIGLEPFAGEQFELPYERDGMAFSNLVGVIRGDDPGARPVLVGAHYDSVIDAPCADDNAAAVAVALALAEHFRSRGGLKRDLIIALFDAEEPPFFHTPAMGSMRFYEDHCRGIDFACAIIMDLVGHDVELQHPAASMMPTLRRLLFVLGAESDAALPGVVEWAACEAKGLKIFPGLNRYVPDMSDHYAFRLGGQPFLFLSCGQGRHYHLPSDDLAWINFDKLRHVFALVADLVTRLDGAEIAGEPCDPVEFEIRMIKKMAGLPFPLLLKAAGLVLLATREDLDALAELLTGGLIG